MDEYPFDDKYADVDSGLKVLIDEDVRTDFYKIMEICLREPFNPDDSYLVLMEDFYMPEAYSNLSPYYKHASIELQKEYENLHDNICFLLYDVEE